MKFRIRDWENYYAIELVTDDGLELEIIRVYDDKIADAIAALLNACTDTDRALRGES